MSRLCLWTIKDVTDNSSGVGLARFGPENPRPAGRANWPRPPTKCLPGLIPAQTVFPPAQIGPAKDRHICRGEILLTGPGRNNTIKLALSQDLKRARQVAIICACFLPPGRILRQMARLARRGLKVQLILPGKSDVFLSHLAGCAKFLSPPFAGRRRGGSDQRSAGALRFLAHLDPYIANKLLNLG